VQPEADRQLSAQSGHSFFAPVSRLDHGLIAKANLGRIAARRIGKLESCSSFEIRAHRPTKKWTVSFIR
jgi:hypothetical protein